MKVTSMVLINLEKKEKAITLRKQGLTYSEILAQVPIAKSTLSLWLRDVGLAKEQKQRITQKKLESAMRGGVARHEQRLRITEQINREAQKEIGKVSRREFWLLGAALYWAEGAKEKSYQPGSGLRFSNSDHRMIRLFLRWLVEICNVPREHISMDLFIHENNTYRVPEVRRFWARETGFPESAIPHVYFKRHNPKTLRKNTGEGYHGVIQVRVRTSSALHRKIAGWIDGMLESLR